MKFSTRVSYGLRALIRLAKSQDQGLSLGVIAKAEHISPKYLEAIFADLKKAGVVSSTQGARGGYRLVKKASVLSVLDVVSALEDLTETLYCVGSGGKKYCSAGCACGVKLVVNKLNEAVTGTLSKIKLANLTN